MKVLVMAAGRGQRFRVEGFEIPKPLIRYEDIPLIEHTLNQLNGIQHSDIIVIGIPEVCHYVKGAHPDIRSIVVEHTQNGPGMSALLAGGFVDDNESVVLLDCDSFVRSDAVHHFIYNVARSPAPNLGEGGIGGFMLTTFKDGDTKAYCTVRVEEISIETIGWLKSPEMETSSYTDNNAAVATVIQEKTGNSNLIAIGVYAFKRWSLFRSTVLEFAYRNPDTEVYISRILSMIHDKGYQVNVDFVHPKAWVCLGTPRELYEAESVNGK